MKLNIIILLLLLVGTSLIILGRNSSEKRAKAMHKLIDSCEGTVKATIHASSFIHSITVSCEEYRDTKEKI